mmetsp:Transcript_8484/g.19906  ORF Transcript_8484/g.19906 Transcript_8484/m.19906 type:complete len:104 (-) Transcript_8484:12-323(-)
MVEFDDAYIRFMTKMSTKDVNVGRSGERRHSPVLESALSDAFRECFADSVVIDLIRTATVKKLQSGRYSQSARSARSSFQRSSREGGARSVRISSESPMREWY